MHYQYERCSDAVSQPESPPHASAPISKPIPPHLAELSIKIKKAKAGDPTAQVELDLEIEKKNKERADKKEMAEKKGKTVDNKMQTGQVASGLINNPGFRQSEPAKAVGVKKGYGGLAMTRQNERFPSTMPYRLTSRITHARPDIGMEDVIPKLLDLPPLVAPSLRGTQIRLNNLKEHFERVLKQKQICDEIAKMEARNRALETMRPECSETGGEEATERTHQDMAVEEEKDVAKGEQDAATGKE